MHLACANMQMGRPGQGMEREQLPALGCRQMGNLGTAVWGSDLWHWQEHCYHALLLGLNFLGTGRDWICAHMDLWSQPALPSWVD